MLYLVRRIFLSLLGLSVAYISLITFYSFHSEAAAEGGEFLKAVTGYKWSFPRDHGRHDGYQSEWWYYTGQLYATEARPFRDKPRYGYQLTFFRRQSSSDAPSEYLAHAALTDIAAGRTYFSARRGGGLLGVAGAASGSLEVWSGDWLAELIDSRHILRFSTDLGGGIARIRLIGSPDLSPWLQGDGGYSFKGGCASCGSSYYSLGSCVWTLALLICTG
jgi:predicted secreted hydrolase